MADFKLSAQLQGHSSDVRDLAFPSPDLILSASRDRTARAWRRTSTSPPTYDSTIAAQADKWVSTVTYIPPSNEHPEGLVVSGGQDLIIDVRPPTAVSTDNAERILPGHGTQVCCLAVAPNGKWFVSGSWDRQARVWSLDTWETKVVLEDDKQGERMSVLAVLPLSDFLVATGSADGVIRIYNLREAKDGRAKPLPQTLPKVRGAQGHPDSVRGLCQVPKGHPSGADFASSHTSGRIILWKLNGNAIQEIGQMEDHEVLEGKESMVYSLATLPTGEIVSSDGDRRLRIWRGQQCVQTITHPNSDVWAVAVCPETGDIATGTGDGVIRIFTRSPDRVASPAAFREYDEAVRSSAIPAQTLGTQINKEKLPGPEFLTSKVGTKEGQVQMIREENGSISAHTWSMGAQSWVNVGTVVDAPSSGGGRKVEYKGKMYDFVFDVAIEEGQPSLKLPFNLSDNPYTAATKFIADNSENGVTLNHLDQVAQFITQNTQGSSLGSSGDVGGADPYGTESRYRPGEDQGSVRTRTLPQRLYLTITAAKYDPVFKKIRDINSNLQASGRQDISLNDSALSSLETLRQSLESSQPVTEVHAVALLFDICSQWDYKDRLAPLDLLRCCATSSVAAKYTERGTPLKLAIDAALSGVPQAAEPNEHLVMMALRVTANLFVSQEGQRLVSQSKETDLVLSFVERVLGLHGSKPIGTSNRNLLIALATVAVNYAVLASNESGKVQPREQHRLLKSLAHLLQNQKDSEVVYRSLVAAGTLITSMGKAGSGEYVEQAIKTAKDRGTESRVKEVADEILGSLQ